MKLIRSCVASCTFAASFSEPFTNTNDEWSFDLDENMTYEFHNRVNTTTTTKLSKFKSKKFT